jgi:hypothetical protein
MEEIKGPIIRQQLQYIVIEISFSFDDKFQFHLHLIKLYCVSRFSHHVNTHRVCVHLRYYKM